MTPGLLRCALLAVCLTAGIVQAGPETSLAMQDITLHGRVTAPSCTVRFENSQLTFAAMGQGNNKEGMTSGAATQVLKLQVSECNADGIGMRFAAEHWPEMPVRGMLRSVAGRTASEAMYYTLGPGDESDATWPLKRVQNEDVPEVKKGQTQGEERRYYRLSGDTYWYDFKTPLQGDSDRMIPLAVELHPARQKDNKTAPRDTSGTFTLELSWR